MIVRQELNFVFKMLKLLLKSSLIYWHNVCYKYSLNLRKNI